MASKTLIVLEDDLDGSEAAETVQFAIDGVAYEIDLSKQNAEKLRAGVQPFAEKARRPAGVPLRSSGRKARRGGKRTNGHGPVDTRAVRAWAASNGVQVSTGDVFPGASCSSTTPPATNDATHEVKGALPGTGPTRQRDWTGNSRSSSEAPAGQ